MNCESTERSTVKFREMRNTNHLGSTAFELFFVIKDLGPNQIIKYLEGQTFDIHGLAQMKFFIQNVDGNKYVILLSVKKHQMALLLTVEMKVKVSATSPTKSNYQHTFTCSENWSEHSSMLTTQYTNTDVHLNLEVEIDVASTKSMLDNMYFDEDFTDFHLTTAEDNVAVHRACLASLSDVFRRMLCGEWKETDEGQLKIKGVTLQTLQHLKQYMYLGTLPEDGLRPLLLIAMCYLIEELKAHCIIKLAHSITSENLYDLLEFTYANNIPELTFAILETVRAQPRNVIDSANQIMMKVKNSKTDETTKQ